MHLFHKWGKWEEYEQQSIAVPSLRGYQIGVEPVKILENMQKRTCLLCGFTQREKVKNS